MVGDSQSDIGSDGSGQAPAAEGGHDARYNAATGVQHRCGVLGDRSDRRPDAAVEMLRSRPESVELLAVTTTEAEAEIRAGMPPGEPMWSDGPGLVASVRIRVDTDADANTLIKYAADLQGVSWADAYVGAIDAYPPWSYQGSTVVEYDVTTTTSVGPVATEADLPSITLNAFGGSESVNLSELERPLLMVLWAPWCVPCNSQVAVVEQVAAARPGLNVVGVAVETTGTVPATWADDLDSWLSEWQPTYRNYQDDGELWAALDAYGLPVVVLVQQGDAAQLIPGELTTDELLREIDERS